MKISRKSFRIFIILALAGFSGSIGFYFGVKTGSNIMATMANQNVVSRAFSRVRISLDAIDNNNLPYSISRHKMDMVQALYDIGVYAPELPNWRCSEKDKSALKAARDYLEVDFRTYSASEKNILDRAVNFCH